MRDIEERQEKESLPENPLKTWRAKYDNNSLTTEDFINYFHAACPFFINIKAEGEAGESDEKQKSPRFPLNQKFKGIPSA